MSLPVSSFQETSGCIPISSECVIWPGPDIPCINLCKGDSVTKAINELATRLCNSSEGIVDISVLDLSCILSQDQENPESLTEILQLMITKICEEIQPESPDQPAESQIQLPECLQYVQNGIPVTSLPIEDYALLLAGTICQLLDLSGTYQNALTNILQRLEQLEQATIVFPAEPMISAQCISGEVPGEVKSISEAFVNLETYLCGLKEVLGENNELISAVSKQCAGLATKTSLSNPLVTMNQLSGWKNSPSTISDTVHNLWIAVCDIRSKLENC
jgi:hypothetical protein